MLKALMVCALLLKRNHDTRLSLHSSNGRHKWNIAGAETCGNRQVELVKASAGQSRKDEGRRRHAHVIDENVHRVSGHRGWAGEPFAGRPGRPGRYRRVRRPKSHGVK